MNARILCWILLTLASAASAVRGQEQPGADFAQPVRQQPAEPLVARTYQKGVVIEVTGVILPRLQKYLDRQLDRAQQLDADLVILQIDSPGGELEATFQIADRLRDLGWAHTVAYIPSEALSGAAIISLGCDEIVMGPQARLGDAGPIFLGPDQLFHHAPEKLRSDLARRVRDLASSKGRSPALAEAMVDMNLIVYRTTDKQTGEITFMSQHEIDSSENPDVWEKGPPVLESREGSFLEVNGQRAVELQLADATVANKGELAQRFPPAQGPLIELFILPGFGIAGITGLVLMAAGIIMASQNHWIPQSPRAMTHLGNSLLVLVGSGAVSLIGVAILSRYYGSLPILNRLVLRTPTATNVQTSPEKGPPLPPAQRFQASVGDWGVSDSPLRPAGKAIFGDDYLDVVTDGSFVERGRQVRIIQISGNRIVVREIEPQV